MCVSTGNSIKYGIHMHTSTYVIYVVCMFMYTYYM